MAARDQADAERGDCDARLVGKKMEEGGGGGSNGEGVRNVRTQNSDEDDE